MSAPDWVAERTAELRKREQELAAQLAADKLEPDETVRVIRVTTTNLQIILNEAHIEMLRTFTGGKE